MSIEFQAALNYINLGVYDKAEEMLRAAVKKEMDKGKEETAIQYRCVLGELFADIGKEKESRTEFEAVLDYCEENGTLYKQREIAQNYLMGFGKNKK